MAKSREPVHKPEPEESIGTDEEEEEESSEEEEEEDGSDDEPAQPKTRSNIPTPQKQPPPPSSSDEEEDAESDTDSDTPSPKPDPNIKPIASKPMVDEPPPKSAPTAASGTKRARSKPGSAGPTSPTKAGVKRPPEKDNEAKETKKSKKKPEVAGEVGENSEKKAPQLFQRLWSEEDEIVILKGMMDYATKKKADPVADIGAFLEFIKKSLHVDVTKTQLQDKIRRLKRKYENNASKEKNGKERTFSKPHEQTAYELSKKIWGSASENNGNVGSEKVPATPRAVAGSVTRKSRSKNVAVLTPKLNEVADKEMKDAEVENNVETPKKNGSVVGGSSFSVGLAKSLEEWIMNDGLKMLEDAKREELEEKWRKVKEREVELFLQRTELMCEQARFVLETMRKSEH